MFVFLKITGGGYLKHGYLNLALRQPFCQGVTGNRGKGSASEEPEHLRDSRAQPSPPGPRAPLQPKFTENAVRKDPGLKATSRTVLLEGNCKGARTLTVNTRHPLKGCTREQTPG